MATVLVTGGLGFIGSHFIRYMLRRHPTMKIVNVDNLSFASNRLNLADIFQKDNYTEFTNDICDKVGIFSIFKEFAIDYVVNFAAETHVDRSITDPGSFISSNFNGVMNLLEAARAKWSFHETSPKFIQISTDEVYGSVRCDIAGFDEYDRLAPGNPYSACKAGADHLCMSYYNTYGLPIAITRCANNFGPNQHPEKFIPTIIQSIINNQQIPLYGEGTNIRNWIYVLDHCAGIEQVMLNGQSGQIYNIGTHDYFRNIDLIKEIIKYMNAPESLISYVADRMGHDRCYSLDWTKMARILKWKPQYNFYKSLYSTVDWYVNNQDWISSCNR